ncbi:nuclear transport factor 2 family protein [Kribbella sp. CWNU-51]
MTRTTEFETVDRYLAVWSERDPGSRRRMIAALWRPDGVEFVEGAQFRGHDELEARITEAYQEFVESGKYAVSGGDDATAHHDVVTFTIQLISSGGELAWAARVVLVVDDDGRLQEDYQLTVKPLAT